MKLVIYPPVEADRLEAVPGCCRKFFDRQRRDRGRSRSRDARRRRVSGKITPAMLTPADRLTWVQSFTASLEHYMFPALVASLRAHQSPRSVRRCDRRPGPGLCLCFARNLHTYIRRQVDHRYEPIGGESARVSNQTGPGTVNDMDRSTIYLPAFDARHRRHGRNRLRDRSPGTGFWNVSPRARSLSRSSQSTRRRSVRRRH